MACKIVLASSSPYRREAFGFLGIPFECATSDVDESFASRERPETLVAALSKMKAESVAKRFEGQDALVIGMDSVGYMNGLILEKPKSRNEAFLRLKAMSGNTLSFFTGVHIVNIVNDCPTSKVVKTNVSLRMISDKEIERCLDLDPRYPTMALGVDFLGGMGATFVREISGSHNNVLRGIPVEEMPKLLRAVGCDIESLY